MRKPKPITTTAETRAERVNVGEGILIPDADQGCQPDHNITPGFYDRTGVVALMRHHKTNPDAIQFLADMME